MKKLIAVTLAAVCVAASLAGCGSSSSSGSTDSQGSGSAAASTTAESTDGMSGAISVISREDGSGTRGAFIELTGVEEKNEAGEKVDNTVDTAEITNSTAVMMTTVAGNKSSIGYISLGSLDDSVKAVEVDGIAPSAEAVKDGSYKVS